VAGDVDDRCHTHACMSDADTDADTNTTEHLPL
jgi:hypothetical protein